MRYESAEKCAHSWRTLDHAMSIDTHIETAGSLLFEMPRVRKTVVREEKCACDGKRERDSQPILAKIFVFVWFCSYFAKEIEHLIMK